MQVDVVLIGTGIMSATLGMLLKTLAPTLKVVILERLDRVAAESSDAWNNAGTGHAAYCELNYTPELAKGEIEVSKALKIASAFEESKALWASWVADGTLGPPETFLRRIPHHSFVWGETNVTYLQKRYKALKPHPIFAEMDYTEDRRQLSTWLPLVMANRDKNQPVAATRMELGTDIDFGALTRSLISSLKKQPDVQVRIEHEVRDLSKQADGQWKLVVKDLKAQEKYTITTKFVFIGAGGGSLPLLDKADLPEAAGYGGFPIGGQWLRCTNQDIIDRHFAKVYGRAEVGAPPMSVPHLDTRLIEGKRALLFGPFAGFSTKFLKHGSYFDLPLSVELDNFIPMIAVGLHNFNLIQYLIEQVSLSHEDRMTALRQYFPKANHEDWVLSTAGQRVQIIKRDPEKGGILAFGTEVIAAADGSLAALLGASPGASTSTSVSIMLDVLNTCFPDQMASAAWQSKLRALIPSYGTSLGDDAHQLQVVRRRSHSFLRLS